MLWFLDFVFRLFEKLDDYKIVERNFYVLLWILPYPTSHGFKLIFHALCLSSGKEKIEYI